jgi:hypothetical protein
MRKSIRRNMRSQYGIAKSAIMGRIKTYEKSSKPKKSNKLNAATTIYTERNKFVLKILFS